MEEEKKEVKKVPQKRQAIKISAKKGQEPVNTQPPPKEEPKPQIQYTKKEKQEPKTEAKPENKPIGGPSNSNIVLGKDLKVLEKLF